MVRSLLFATLIVGSVVSASLAIVSKSTAQEPAPPVNLSAQVDGELAGVWRRDQIKPAPRSSDAEFLRRVYLDTTGATPSREEAAAFSSDPDTNRRETLIDALTSDPRFGRYMADIWTSIIVGRGAGQLNASDLFAVWMARRINEGAGFDAIIREVLTASGNLADTPAIAVYFKEGEARDLRDVAGKLTRVFSGVQIQCAQCHKHPYEKWTQADFSGMTSYFIGVQARVNNDLRPGLATAVDSGENLKRINDAVKKRSTLNKEQLEKLETLLPFTKPKTLNGVTPASSDPTTWRKDLAKWFTAAGNTQTPRYVVNRLFAIAFGRGLHEPVDDFNSLTSPSHPQLLEALTADFVANSWDLRRLYRALLKSDAWQLSSSGRDAKAQPSHFAAYPVRPLGPESFIASLVAFGDAAELGSAVKVARNKVFDDLRAEAARFEKNKEEGKLPANERRYVYDLESVAKYEKWVAEMPDAWLLRRTAAARYARLATDDEMAESESFTLSIDQALAVMNGAFTNKISMIGGDSLLARIFKETNDPAGRIKALYLGVLCREPSEAELIRALDWVKAPARAPKIYEDLMFALLMTTEFATNH